LKAEETSHENAKKVERDCRARFLLRRTDKRARQSRSTKNLLYPNQHRPFRLLEKPVV
jgi:hypothetical protein